MATILVYNNSDGGIERYTRAPSDPMPYNVGGTLTVSEFLGNNDFGWTDVDTMQAWNNFRAFYGQPVRVDFGFLRIAQIDPALGVPTAQHLMGTAFAAGSNLSQQRRAELVDAANESNAFSVVQPFSARETNAYFDRRYMPSNTFITAGLPTMARNDRSNYVMSAQDLLNFAGYSAGNIDGIFGPNTERALRRFQTDRWLTSNGILGRLEWESLVNQKGAII